MIAHIEQAEEITPLITCEFALRQDVCELVFGVHIFDLDLWVKAFPVQQPVKRNSVNSGNMSHRWTLDFKDHLDHCFIILENLRHGTLMRRFHVFGDMIDIGQLKILVL